MAPREQSFFVALRLLMDRVDDFTEPQDTPQDVTAVVRELMDEFDTQIADMEHFRCMASIFTGW